VVGLYLLFGTGSSERQVGATILPLKHVCREQAMTRRLSRAGKFLPLSAKVELAGNSQICLPRHLFQSIPYRFFGFALDKVIKTSVQEHS